MTAWLAFLLTTLRLSTPLIYASVGGYCSERSGTINIGLEGMTLLAAFSAALTAYLTHNPFWGTLAGIGGGLLLATLHGLLCIEAKADQIISGFAVNLIALGLPPVISKALFDISGGTPMLTPPDRVPQIFGMSPIVIGAFAAAAFFFFIHRTTTLGQYFRFAGDHPEALQSQGISVRRVRWQGVLFSGALCGLAGAYLSIDHGSGFARNMTAGRGFIALAALIIGRWTPHGALAASLAFGAIEASQILLQGSAFLGGTVPIQWIQMLPYAATLAILAGVVGGRSSRSKPPRALGQGF